MTYRAFQPAGASVLSFMSNLDDPERPYQVCGVKGAVHRDGIPGLRSDTYPVTQQQAIALIWEVASTLTDDGIDVNAALQSLAQARERTAERAS